MLDDPRQVLIKAHRGHEESARALWNAHSGRLLAFAGAILRDGEDASDVVQGVFCGLFGLPAARVRAVEDPAAFLVRMARSGALNHLRSMRRERARLRRRAPAGDAEAGAPSGWRDGELERAVDRLPRREREVIVLKHQGGLTFDQMALALDQNRNTVAGRYRSGLERLRGWLSAEPDRAVGAGTSRTAVYDV